MVELKKELPEIFEEFAEQRKNSFLAVTVKRSGNTGSRILLYLFSAGDCNGNGSCNSQSLFYIG